MVRVDKQQPIRRIAPGKRACRGAADLTGADDRYRGHLRHIADEVYCPRSVPPAAAASLLERVS
jgi:hypothetical protein